MINVGLEPIKANFTKVKVGPLTLWFSYETVIAFSTGLDIVARVNDWNNTTGRHIGELEPDKKARIESNLFEAQLNKEMGQFTFNEVEA